MQTINKVVARYKDGTILKGHTSDFFPNKNTFHLELLDGKIIDVNIEQLKALYFVKDFAGNKDHKDTYIDIVAGGGRKIEVLFKDGEKIIGYSQGYAPNRIGFFVIPADKNQNNDRVFVITSATEKVTFL